MCDVLFVTYDWVHLSEDLRQIILTGGIQSIFCFAVFALLIYIDCKNILPVSHKQAVCRCGSLTSVNISCICNFILFFIFLLDCTHHRCKIIRKSQMIIILQAVQIEVLARMDVGCIIYRSSCLSCGSCIICKRIVTIIIVIILLFL